MRVFDICKWCLFLGCMACMSGCGHEEAAPVAVNTAPVAVPVTIVSAQRRPIETAIDVVGTLKGWEDVKVGAEKTGRVIKIMHEVGDSVLPGEPLVQLDTLNAELQLQQADKRLCSELAKLGLQTLPEGEFDVGRLPSVVQAQVAVDRAKYEYAREQQLSEKKVNTVQSLQEAEFKLREAKASLDNSMLTARATLAAAVASRVELDVARKALTDMVVRAPKPSKVPEGLASAQPLAYAMVKRTVSEGQMMREGEEVAQLVIDNPLRLWATVPERFGGAVKKGQDVRLAVTSHPDQSFPGTVTWVNPSVDTATRTFQVEVAVPNDQHQLRPGGFVKAAIVVERKDDRTVVPVESILRFAGVTKLFVVRDNNAYSVPVEAGIEEAGWVEVIGAIDPDAQVVVTGHSRLADATPIVIRHAQAADSSGAPQPSNGAPQSSAPAATTAMPDSTHEKPADTTAG